MKLLNRPGPPRRLARVYAGLAWVGGGAVLTLVSLSYLHPHLMLDLADRLWSCF